jgi:hypothetical protein
MGIGDVRKRRRIQTWTAFLTRSCERINRISDIFKPSSLADKSGM